jgi:hypothetical protein
MMNVQKLPYNDLIHMNSGLEWEEDYGKISDVTKMLFIEEDMTKSQMDKPAALETQQTLELFFRNNQFT